MDNASVRDGRGGCVRALVGAVLVLAAFAVVPAELRAGGERGDRTVADVLEAAEVPEVGWEDVPLSRVIRTIGELSRELDPWEEGVNIVVFDPEERDPYVSMRLRNLSLKRILQLVAIQVDFSLEIHEDVVVLRAVEAPRERMETEIFPVTRPMLIRMIGPPEERESDEPYDPFR